MEGIIATLRANEFLNVRFLATEDEIKAAYRALMLRYHPDKNRGQEERSAWVVELLQRAKDDALVKCRDRKYPHLEHYKPIPIDDLMLCTCGWPRDSTTIVCDGCATVFMPKDDTKANKDAVWAAVRQYARNLKTKIGKNMDDWELAGMIFRRHFS